jgi:hypothetical protein
LELSVRENKQLCKQLQGLTEALKAGHSSSESVAKLIESYAQQLRELSHQSSSVLKKLTNNNNNATATTLSLRDQVKSAMNNVSAFSFLSSIFLFLISHSSFVQSNSRLDIRNPQVVQMIAEAIHLRRGLQLVDLNITPTDHLRDYI